MCICICICICIYTCICVCVICDSLSLSLPLSVGGATHLFHCQQHRQMPASQVAQVLLGLPHMYVWDPG